MVNKQNVPINFEGYKITDISYHQKNSASDFKTGVRTAYALSGDATYGLVRMTACFENATGKMVGEITIQGNFSLDEMLTDDRAKMFLAQNGAAMLYPYLRSVTSMLTAFDSESVTVLPSLNFVDLYKQNE